MIVVVLFEVKKRRKNNGFRIARTCFWKAFL